MEPIILFGYIPPVAPVGDQPPPAPAKTQLDSYEEELGFLRKSYSDYRDDNSASKALSDQLQQARTNVDLMINRQDVRFKVAFDQLLRPPIKGASNAYSKTLAKGAGLSWCAAVVEPHDTTIDARYPFERTGHDMSFDDFAAFYAPTGTLWTFYDEVLKTYIRREGNDFEWNRRLGKSQGSVFAPNLQQFLERSYDITHVFFPTGAESPRVDFDLRVRPHPRVAIQQVTIGGKMIEYHNGPEEWHRFSWPGEEDPGQGALLEVRGADGMHERIEQEGEWGLFHLIEEGTVLSGSGRGFTIVWHLRTHDVDITIDFRPVREDTPFFGVVGRSRSPRLLQPMRNTNLDPPRDITIGGALTCPRRPTTVAVNAPRGM
jgi:type VI secretion system protein ImpL